MISDYNEEQLSGDDGRATYLPNTPQTIDSYQCNCDVINQLLHRPVESHFVLSHSASNSIYN